MRATRFILKSGNDCKISLIFLAATYSDSNLLQPDVCHRYLCEPSASLLPIVAQTECNKTRAARARHSIYNTTKVTHSVLEYSCD